MADDPTPTPAPEPTPSPAPEPAPSPTPEPSPAPSGADWRTDLPDDLKPHAQRFTSIADVVRGNMELRSERDRLRTTAIVPPGKEAKPEDVAAYREKIGVPPEAIGYADLFPAPTDREFTDGEKASNDAWAKRFHDLNVPKDVAKTLVDSFREEIATQQAQIVAEDERYAQETERQLKSEWGGEYAQNIEYSNRAVQALAERAGVDVEELRHLETADRKFVFDNPLMQKMFASLGREMQEGNLGPAMTEAQMSDANSRLRTIREGIRTAQANRDSGEANRLYLEEQRLLEQIQGSKPIVGAQGRAA